jgi:hypothetical protein
VVVSRIGKFRKLTLREQMLFLEALLLHLWTGLLLKIIPFRWIQRVFSSRKSKVESRKSGEIELIRNAIQRAGRVSPWRNRCLVSSLVGRCMLRRRKISSQLYLGVAKNPEGNTIAHAWLKVGEYEMVDRRGDYTELFSF